MTQMKNSLQIWVGRRKNQLCKTSINKDYSIWKQKERLMKKNEESIRETWEIIKCSKIHNEDTRMSE